MFDGRNSIMVEADREKRNSHLKVDTSNNNPKKKITENTNEKHEIVNVKLSTYLSYVTNGSIISFVILIAQYIFDGLLYIRIT